MLPEKYVAESGGKKESDFTWKKDILSVYHAHLSPLEIYLFNSRYIWLCLMTTQSLVYQESEIV